MKLNIVGNRRYSQRCCPTETFKLKTTNEATSVTVEKDDLKSVEHLETITFKNVDQKPVEKMINIGQQ